MISRDTADRVALDVWRLTRLTLDEANLKLEAFAYSGNSVERWLVCEVYARLWKEWDRLPGRQDGWDTWMEAILPGQKTAREHVDLFVGEWEKFPPKPIYYQPQPTTPVFEFKIVRSDDLTDRCDGVRWDVDKLARGGFCNKYLVIVYRIGGISDASRIRADLRAAVPGIVAIGEPWGPRTIPLQRYNAGSVTLHAEAFRVQS